MAGNTAIGTIERKQRQGGRLAPVAAAFVFVAIHGLDAAHSNNSGRYGKFALQVILFSRRR